MLFVLRKGNRKNKQKRERFKIVIKGCLLLILHNL